MVRNIRLNKHKMSCSKMANTESAQRGFEHIDCVLDAKVVAILWENSPSGMLKAMIHPEIAQSLIGNGLIAPQHVGVTLAYNKPKAVIQEIERLFSGLKLKIRFNKRFWDCNHSGGKVEALAVEVIGVPEGASEEAKKALQEVATEPPRPLHLTTGVLERPPFHSGIVQSELCPQLPLFESLPSENAEM